MVPAFITALLALSSPTAPASMSRVAHQQTSKPRPRMLPCGVNGECPPGSRCLKLFQSFGVCVVEDSMLPYGTPDVKNNVE